jgi:DeoR family transcriptional regulator, deoxyribose operon repressor
MDRQRARLGKIFDTIKISNAATIRELATKLSVSEMTIRRDLMVLEKENMVKLIHGGAVLNPVSESTMSSKDSVIDSGSHKRAEKLRIGQKAASLLEPGDIIGLDLGITAECLARSIPDNMPLTVLCYSLNVLLEVYHKNACKLIFAGGYFHENTLMFESKEGLRLLSSVRSTKAFMAASGVSKDLGITTPDHHEMEAKSTLMKNSLTKILIADSSKFGAISTTHFADITDFDIIISDTAIPAEYEQLIRDAGITLYLA